MTNAEVSVRIYDREYEVKDRCLVSRHLGHLTGNAEQLAYSPEYVRNVTMCVHVSSKCNLNCTYCFKSDWDAELTFSDIQRFIEHVTMLYPRADRYTVDMSGAGEPLLRIDLVLKIAEYCRRLSDRFVREFLPVLVTNGTLLDSDVAKQLQDSGVLFGVSFDGIKEVHDRNRVFVDGSGSYDIVEKNVKAIKNNEYVGIAMTYSGGCFLDSFIKAVSLAPTVSMKPVRYTDDGAFDVETICSSYDELVRFVLDNHINGEHKYIFALINGEDYFGKFIKRVITGRPVYGRCDAGIGRFALAPDKKIYCCPAGIGKPGCEMGDLDNGIRRNKIDKMWKSQLNPTCQDCYARSACGGECKIVSYNRYGSIDKIDKNMCMLKKHLFLLAVYYCDSLQEQSPKEYEWMADQIQNINSYSAVDGELVNAVKRSNGKYSFSQLKKIKDTSADTYYGICSAEGVNKNRV